MRCVIAWQRKKVDNASNGPLAVEIVSVVEIPVVAKCRSKNAE